MTAQSSRQGYPNDIAEGSGFSSFRSSKLPVAGDVQAEAMRTPAGDATAWASGASGSGHGVEPVDFRIFSCFES